MKTINLNPLQTLIRRAEGGAEELAKLARIEAEAKTVIDEVLADGNIEDEREQQKLSSARLRLDLVPARRKKLLADQPKQIEELNKEHKARSHEWKVLANQRREEVRNDITSALAPYYPDSRRELKKLVERLDAPVLLAIDRAGTTGTEYHGHNPKPESFIDAARGFVQWVRRYSKLLGVEISES